MSTPAVRDLVVLAALALSGCELLDVLFACDQENDPECEDPERGHILGTEVVEDNAGVMTGYTRIRAVVPQAELHLYASTLQSMTQGRAASSMEFAHYEPLPPNLAQELVSKNQRV